MRCNSTRLTAIWQPETRGRFHLPHCPIPGVHFSVREKRMNFIDRRQLVPASNLPRADRTRRPQAMAIAIVCAFCATPFQAAAVMCDIAESYDWVDCCDSEATIVNRSLISQKELAHGHIEGTLALKFKVSYSAGTAPGSGYASSRFACAKLNVTVRIGDFRRTYDHDLHNPSGVPDYIEDTTKFVFVPPFRSSDVYVESVACKMPKVLEEGNPCGQTKRRNIKSLIGDMKGEHQSRRKKIEQRVQYEQQQSNESNLPLAWDAAQEQMRNQALSASRLTGVGQAGSRCDEIVRQIAQNMEANPRGRTTGSICGGTRELLGMYQYAKENLSNHGCYGGEYDTAIAQLESRRDAVCE